MRCRGPFNHRPMEGEGGGLAVEDIGGAQTLASGCRADVVADAPTRSGVGRRRRAAAGRRRESAREAVHPGLAIVAPSRLASCDTKRKNSSDFNLEEG